MSLISEYDFSSGLECSRDVNIENWWVVRLTLGNVSGQEWGSDELSVSKSDLYRQYSEECVGDTRGVVYFWGNLQRLVPFVSQSSSSVVLPSLEVARNYSHGLNLDEHSQAFVASSQLSQ